MGGYEYSGPIKTPISKQTANEIRDSWDERPKGHKNNMVPGLDEGVIEPETNVEMLRVQAKWRAEAAEKDRKYQERKQAYIDVMRDQTAKGIEDWTATDITSVDWSITDTGRTGLSIKFKKWPVSKIVR